MDLFVPAKELQRRQDDHQAAEAGAKQEKPASWGQEKCHEAAEQQAEQEHPDCQEDDSLRMDGNRTVEYDRIQDESFVWNHQRHLIDVCFDHGSGLLQVARGLVCNQTICLRRKGSGLVSQRSTSDADIDISIGRALVGEDHLANLATGNGQLDRGLVLGGTQAAVFQSKALASWIQGLGGEGDGRTAGIIRTR